MATLDQMKTALRNADAAGDTAAATQLAKSIKAIQEPSVASDVAQTIPAALRRGTEMLAGLPGDVNAMTQSAAGRVSRALFGDKATEQIKQYVPTGLRSEGVTTPDIQKTTNQFMGPGYESKTRPGRYTGAVVEQLPGMVIGPGGKMAKIAAAVLGGVGGEAAGELSGNNPWAKAGGSMIGALAGGRVPGPAQTTREAAQAANVAALQRERVPLTAGQQTGSTAKKYIESELGGSAFDSALDRQRTAFTDAAMRRLGEAGGAALPEDLARARARIGGEFDRLAENTLVPFDPQLQTAITDIGARYEQIAPMQAPAVRQLFNSMIDKAHLNNGMLTGEQYKEMSTTLRSLSEGADPAAQEALNGFRDALDSAVERNLRGADLEEWQRARRQYANLMTVERAMTGGGVEAASGQVAPTRLRSAISGGGQGPAAIAEGRSNMTDLANAGVGVMKDMPQSGTAPRLAARAIPAAAAAVGAGMTTGDPFSVLGASLAGFAAPEIIGNTLMSPFGQSALRGPTESQRRQLAALLSARLGGAGQGTGP